MLDLYSLFARNKTFVSSRLPERRRKSFDKGKLDKSMGINRGLFRGAPRMHEDGCIVKAASDSDNSSNLSKKRTTKKVTLVQFDWILARRVWEGSESKKRAVGGRNRQKECRKQQKVEEQGLEPRISCRLC